MRQIQRQEKRQTDTGNNTERQDAETEIIHSHGKRERYGRDRDNTAMERERETSRKRDKDTEAGIKTEIHRQTMSAEWNYTKKKVRIIKTKRRLVRNRKWIKRVQEKRQHSKKNKLRPRQTA